MSTYHPQSNGKAKQNASEYAQGILLEVYDGLGQMFAASGASVQKLTTLNNSDQPFHDAAGREIAMPLTFFYPEYERQKTSPQAYVKEAIKRQQS